MSATQEDFGRRLQRLEEGFQELRDRMSPPLPSASADFAELISFRAWMKLSAPTFAIMLAGFMLLWNSQQAMGAQMFEMSRSLGRLDGAIERLEVSMTGFDQRLVGIGERLLGIDERLLGIDERLLGIDERLLGIDERLEAFDGTLRSLDASVAKLGAAVDRLAARP